MKHVLVPSTVNTYMVGMKYPMPGIAGGKDGAPNELITTSAPTRAHKVERMANGVPHAAGEAFRVLLRRRRRLGRSARARPERVLDDVLDEYVSVEAARRDYGVVLTGSLEALDLAVDAAGAPRRLRAERR